MPARISAIGRTFGKLKVIAELPDGIRKSGNARRVTCQCECGTIKDFFLNGIAYGNTVSCGCFAKSYRPITHGMSYTRIYRIWVGMNRRCRDTRDIAFQHYGGRGITVCERWTKFEPFFEDMGEGKRGWTLERINNGGNYCPENCCWATRTHQARNTRNIKFYCVNGITGGMSELAERFGIHRTTVFERISLGWSVVKAFTQPTGLKRRRQEA